MNHRSAAALLCLALAAAAAPQAFAKTCEVSIGADDMMQFDKSEIRIAADCTQVSVTLAHTGKLPASAMGHNWVLAKTADVDALAAEGLRATLADSYLPRGDVRVVAFTKVVGGGESATVSFPVAKLEKGGEYTFFCSFPGHSAIMKGRLLFG